MSSPRVTTLREAHLALGARMMDFAGWSMPVQYAGILDEHRAVRTACGIFDISHMGEVFVRGPGAAAWLDRMLTASISSLPAGRARYALLLNEQAGVIDDLIVYRLDTLEFLLVVNASKTDEDVVWLRSHLGPEVTIEDVSGLFSAVAVQGPSSPEVLHRAFGIDSPVARNRVVDFPGREGGAWFCGTGYTGERGCEIVCRNEEVGEVWTRLLDAGAVPCGLGARDLLRLEMGYPLNGSDLCPERTPLEAGLDFAVSFAKGDFIGREVLDGQRSGGPPSRLAGLRVEGKSPPIRPHYPVSWGQVQVSETTSGGLSPVLGTSIAMAYLPPGLAIDGTPLEISVRGQRHAARVVPRPFIQSTSLT